MIVKSAWKHGRTLALIALAAMLLAALPGPAAAQNYSFEVPLVQMEVFIQSDGSARIVYDLTFNNQGSAIDVVDIGMPNANYDFSNMQASIGGAALTDIRRSQYVDPGVEVHLDGHAIPFGKTGVLHFEFTMPRMVYQDVTRRDDASFQITPTWFDGQFVQGQTQFQIAVHTQPGVTPEELLYQGTPFTSKIAFQDHAVAGWQFTARMDGPHMVGLSFPRRGLTYVVPFNVLDLVNKWLRDNPAVGLTLAGIFLVLFAILFFRFSGGTGLSVFVILGGLLAWLFYSIPYMLLFGFLPLGALMLWFELGVQRKRKTYLPAIAQVEGGGIKRGLTAPEAAVLLEQPLSRVLGLVVFGLLKKRVLEQVKDSPLTVKLAEPYLFTGQGDKEQAAARLAVAQKQGIVLHGYEHAFLDRIESKPGVPLAQLDFSDPVKALIDGVAQRMKGFDLSDTVDYYRAIVKRAVTEASAVGDVAQREQAIDRNLEWIMMGPNLPTVFQTGGWRYQPMWVRPVILQAGSFKGAASAPTPSAPGGRTSFGDVAAGFAGWAENTMGGLASAIMPIQVSQGGTRMVNLSGADKVTGEVFKALFSSSGSGRGGGRSGGGCACACAGCACACACAGGGR